ncbi:MAG: type II toxin-antitoxin system HicB family antitoxin [Bryobacteraceae bacterium]
MRAGKVEAAGKGQGHAARTAFLAAPGESIELDREDDGRWIAEIPELPGVMAYGAKREEAIGAVQRLAVEVVADRIAHGELPDASFNLAFAVVSRGETSDIIPIGQLRGSDELQTIIPGREREG